MRERERREERKEGNSAILWGGRNNYMHRKDFIAEDFIAKNPPATGQATVLTMGCFGFLNVLMKYLYCIDG